jgi:ubiquinone/menaquinone biosynthesis C-methylase UbiE
MSVSSATAPNHHADYPGFAGMPGGLVGIVMLLKGRAYARLATSAASVCDTDRVVDIGCGPGNAARAGARRGAQVTGIDPASVMLRVARAFTRKRAAITWAEGTAENLPLPDESATVVWSLATVHHWKDVGKGLAEAHRVLAPGGRLVAIERQVSPGATGLASHGWTEQQAESFAAMCRAAGFDNVRIGEQRAGRRAVWTVNGLRP